MEEKSLFIERTESLYKKKNIVKSLYKTKLARRVNSGTGGTLWSSCWAHSFDPCYRSSSQLPPQPAAGLLRLLSISCWCLPRKHDLKRDAVPKPEPPPCTLSNVESPKEHITRAGRPNLSPKSHNQWPRHVLWGCRVRRKPTWWDKRQGWDQTRSAPQPARPRGYQLRAAAGTSKALHR